MKPGERTFYLLTRGECRYYNIYTKGWNLEPENITWFNSKAVAKILADALGAEVKSITVHVFAEDFGNGVLQG